MSRRRGWSLLEVLLAGVLLVLGILPLLGLFGSGRRVLGASGELVRLQAEAWRRLDGLQARIRAGEWAGLPLDEAEQAEANTGDLEARWSLSRAPGHFRVEVRVEGPARAYRVSTRLPDPWAGPGDLGGAP